MTSSGSSSPEPDFLCPNGFTDVDVEHVNLHFSTHNTHEDSFEHTPEGKQPRKKRKKDKSKDCLDTSVVIGRSPEKLISSKNEAPSNCTSDAVIELDESSINEAPSNCTSEVVIDLDEVSSPSPPDASYQFSESISLSDDDCISTEPTNSIVENVNPVMTVKVIWKGRKPDKFQIRKFQKVQEIYTFYSNLENVPEERILITLKEREGDRYEEREVSPSDTPDSLNIGMRFLEGGITDSSEARHGTTVTVDPDSIELKIQQKGIKEKISIFIKKDDSMKVLVSKLAEELNVAECNIKLKFDGDPLDLEETPNSLDLEGGECLDLVLKS